MLISASWDGTWRGTTPRSQLKAGAGERWRPSALRLFAADLMLPLQPEHLRLLAALRLLCQVFKGAPSRPHPHWTPKCLLQRHLVQMGVTAGVLVDGGHAGAVQRMGAAGRVSAWGQRSAGLHGAAGVKAKGGRREGRRFEESNRRRIQAAQELGILGKQTAFMSEHDTDLRHLTQFKSNTSFLWCLYWHSGRGATWRSARTACQASCPETDAEWQNSDFKGLQMLCSASTDTIRHCFSPHSEPGCWTEPRRAVRTPPLSPLCYQPETSRTCWCPACRWSPTDAPQHPAPASCTSPADTGRISASFIIKAPTVRCRSHRSVAEAHGAGFALPQKEEVSWFVLIRSADATAVPTADFTGSVGFWDEQRTGKKCINCSHQTDRKTLQEKWHRSKRGKCDTGDY